MIRRLFPRSPSKPGAFTTVRATILLIGFVPSLVLVIAITTVAGVRIERAVDDREWATEIVAAIPAVVAITDATFHERDLTLRRIAGEAVDYSELVGYRGQLDAAGVDLTKTMAALSEMAPVQVDPLIAQYGAAVVELGASRQRVDAGKEALLDAYGLYSRLAQLGAKVIEMMAHQAPTVPTVVATLESNELYCAVDDMTLAHSLAATLVVNGALPPEIMREFVRRVGGYRTALEQSSTGPAANDLAKLTSSASWRTLSSIEDTLLGIGVKPVRSSMSAAGDGNANLPVGVNEDAWAAALVQVQKDLSGIWSQYFRTIQLSAQSEADAALRSALLTGLAALVAAVITLVVAVRIARRVSGRLKRLRHETLALTDEQLPAIIGRIRQAQVVVDTDIALPTLEFGTDEIGQVADAFNRAQQGAVTAAVVEAKTRSAVNAVFVNIANRSQQMMHRQLEILDEAELRQRDPAMLDLLFKLDHLATTERRNAENLIILGGARPGRRWNNPVPLVDVVRSAISETHDYVRVYPAQMPEVQVEGEVVADVIHMLAELIDNATSFSPLECRVEVSGILVGRGVAIEIVDQGVGIPSEELERLNTELSKTFDFSVLELSSDSRLGLVVVAALAARNEITVKLAESDFGGTRAIVLIPLHLLTVPGQQTADSEMSAAR
ncbi:nitrate- and nitrite sensing domain-containing protein [Nocardia aobensis]|uniref:histidine kinase n=1 Tax=Nocardia aobensis TaxID=257277 RepID=A0ABW6PFG2_9NOCA